jgi:hypothetical protein
LGGGNAMITSAEDVSKMVPKLLFHILALSRNLYDGETVDKNVSLDFGERANKVLNEREANTTDFVPPLESPSSLSSIPISSVLNDDKSEDEKEVMHKCLDYLSNWPEFFKINNKNLPAAFLPRMIDFYEQTKPSDAVDALEGIINIGFSMARAKVDAR